MNIIKHRTTIVVLVAIVVATIVGFGRLSKNTAPQKNFQLPEFASISGVITEVDGNKKSFKITDDQLIREDLVVNFSDSTEVVKVYKAPNGAFEVALVSETAGFSDIEAGRYAVVNLTNNTIKNGEAAAAIVTIYEI